MTAHCCHLADRGLLSDIMEGNWRIAFVFELARKLTGISVIYFTLSILGPKCTIAGYLESNIVVFILVLQY